MTIGSIGYNYAHDGDFLMDRPNGIGCPLFLLIKTSAVFVIAGKEYRVRKNSFVLFTADTPCRYGPAEDGYTDDWMYFELTAEDVEKLRALGIPFNEVMYLGNIEELSQIMHIMAYEHYSAELHHEEIEQQYIEILFLKLSRIIRSASFSSSDAIVEKNYRFTQLRAQIFTAPDLIPDVSGMAQMMNMSRSGFQHMYKKMFGVSVMTDVINGRLDRAKRLLSATNLTIKEIAEKCGYVSEYNFMRQFKSRIGKTPSEYRKSL